MDSATAALGGATATPGAEAAAAARPPQFRWPGEVAAVDRFVAFMLRRADKGGAVSVAILERLARSESMLVRERLIVQNVSHALEKLRNSGAVMQAAVSSDWRSLFEAMVDRGLNRLRTARHAWDVLFFGHEVFEQARRLPFADIVLRSPLYWHALLDPGIQTGVPIDIANALTRGVDVDDVIREATGLQATLQQRWHEADTGRTRAIAPPPAPAKAAVEETAPPPQNVEPGRYTDIAFYEGKLFPGDDASRHRQLPDTEPLRAGVGYSLEVAIRMKRKGIESHLEPPRTVLNPRQDRETLPIHVLVKSRSRSLVVDEPFIKIDWPYNTDSAPAFFRVSVDAEQIPDGNTRAALEVRLYNRLDLLDIVQVTIPVTTARAGTSTPVLPAHLEWADDEGELARIDPQAPVRHLAIHVSRAVGGYLFEFIFARNDGNGRDRPDIVIPITREIGDEDLKQLLKSIRNFWTELAITNYAKALSVTTSTFTGYVGRLALLGRRAWLLLFGEGYGSQTGASETLAGYLAELNLSEGIHIQISYPGSLKSFVFPWNVLYPPPSNGDAIDPLKFWGARFQIEQVFEGSKQDRLGEEPVNVVFALDSAFGNAALETAMFKDYVAASSGRLSVTDPISDEAALEAGLRVSPAAHLVYFFCHGFAPSSPELRVDLLKVMREEIDKLPKAEHAALDTLLAMFSKPGEEPWIHIGNSQIKESTLAGLKFFSQRKPIVFLNMCQSADLLPSVTTGLVRVFLKKSASAVVGTESPMTAVFAHAFAERVLDDLFNDNDLGTALWNTRRHFLSGDVRNLLALAYTLYGRATVRLGRGPIVRTSPSA
jgi:hypothetical protein